MSYTPTEWKTGDIVTAEKLNKLEEGVASGGGGGGGIFWINVTWDDNDVGTLDKTFNEILSAVGDGLLPIVKLYDVGDEQVDVSINPVVAIHTTEDFYVVHVNFGEADPLPFAASSADGTLTYNS